MTLLNSLLQITVFSGVIFFVTLLFKKVFKNKMSPFMHFAVWAVFLLRLVVPVTLDAPIHFVTYQPVPVVMPTQTSQTIDEPVFISPESISVPSGEKSVTTVISDVSAAPVPATAPADPASPPATMAKPLTADQIVLTIWLGGAVLGILYISLLVILLRRKMSLKSAPASSHLQTLFAEVKNELHISARLRLLCLYECGSPALLFPRTILMPMDKLAMTDDEQIKNCLRHECMHYKRRDHLMSLFLTVLNAVYWFNPFMWLAYFEIRKDMETACDSAVVKHLDPGARRGYAELILSLSGNARQIPMVLAMVRSKRGVERRIKGVFMTQTSKRSVKFVSAMLALILLVCCFTTACQPTPAKPVVVNKSGGISADMIDEPLAPGAVKDVDAPQHWTETMTRLDGNLEIYADVDLKIPENLNNTPVNKIEQMTLSPERLQQLTRYFVGDSKLYKPLAMTSFEGLAQLKKIQNGEGSYGEIYEEARILMADKLQEMIDKAPITAEKSYTDLSFTQPYNSDNTIVIDAWLKANGSDGVLDPQADHYVNVFAETGEDYEPMISASTYDSYAAIPSRFHYSYPGSYLTASDIKQLIIGHEMYKDPYYSDDKPMQTYLAKTNQQYAELGEVMNSMTETPEQALAVAQKALDDLGIGDLMLDSVDKGVWLPRQPQEWDELSTPVSQAQAGYSVIFSRSAGQLAGFRENYGGMSANEMLTYSPPFGVEQLSIFVCNGKVLQFDWRNISQTVETIAANTKLLPFDEIKERLADYVSYNFPIIDPANGKVRVDIVDAELRSTQITAKDDPLRAWLVPSWLFRIRLDYSQSDNTSTTINGDYPCEINALDGGIIIPK